MLISPLVRLHANVAQSLGRILDKYFRKPHVATLVAACEILQGETFPKNCLTAERIMAILVPEGNFMSGGIYSMFSIANHMRMLKAQHGYEVILMSRPNLQQSTFFRNTHFRNSENVYRFDQLRNCDHVRELYLHIPEYTAGTFLSDLTAGQRSWLNMRKKVHINIFNQNIRLMPEPKSLEPLKKFTPSISQSVAHHAYFSQKMADDFGLPTMLLPAHTDLTPYPATRFADKEKLIIYSPDDAPHKKRCLKILATKLPGFELREIKDISFDHYMDLATRCMFSVSFGEGFDGYVWQPILQGGIGFTVYNDDFFPSPDFKLFPNFFENADEMQKGIVPLMLSLSRSKARWERLNSKLKARHAILYSYEDYLAKIAQLARRKFDFYPRTVGI